MGERVAARTTKEPLSFEEANAVRAARDSLVTALADQVAKNRIANKLSLVLIAYILPVVFC